MTPRIPLILFVPALSIACVACVHAPLRLVSPADPSPDVRILLKAAQKSLHVDGEPAKAESLAGDLLKKDPDLAAAHRLLMLLAKLRDDHDAAYRHGMRALADTRNRLVGIDLKLLIPMVHGQKRLSRLTRLVGLISREHPNSQARADALGVLVQLELNRGELTLARQALEQRHLIRDWMGIGTFDNKEEKGFDTPLPPETEIDLSRRYPALRTKASWRTVSMPGPVSVVELAENFFPFYGTVIYLVSWVSSPVARQAVLELSMADPAKVWLNDRQVLSLRQVRRLSSRQVRIPVRLQAGPQPRGWLRQIVCSQFL